MSGPSGCDMPSLSGVLGQSAAIQRLSGPEVVTHVVLLVIVEMPHGMQLKEKGST